jgi:hypothetical protein
MNIFIGFFYTITYFSDNHDLISIRTYELDTPEGVSKVRPLHSLQIYLEFFSN